jgi:hypothetical protein
MSDVVTGREIRVGDVVDVWWKPRRDVVVDLVSYDCTVYPEGARIATFASDLRMTIPDDERFQVVVRGPEISS